MSKKFFNSLGKIFTKNANTVGNTAKSIFSKRNADTFRNHLSGVLKEQGQILQTAGKIGAGIALPLALGASLFVPGALPLIAGVGLASAGVGGFGMIESASGNLMTPSIYRNKNDLQKTAAVVNEIERSTKGVKQVIKFG